MRKIYFVKDSNGDEYEVTEEISTDDESITEPEDTIVEDDDSASLTTDELAALKMLAAKATDLLKLLEVEEAEHKAVSEEIDDEDICDEDDYEEKEDKDVVITKDSKRSIGSIEKHKAKDSLVYEDLENEIADAWAKRFK